MVNEVREAPAARWMGVSEFKARCLELLERVHRTGDEYVITKHGKPIARVSPIRQGSGPLRGLMQGRLTIQGDIVNMDFTEEWEAASQAGPPPPEATTPPSRRDGRKGRTGRGA